MAERLDWIDALKGISIVLVVMMHVITVGYSIPFNMELFERSLVDSANYFFAFNLAPLRMPLFFMISGFLAHKSVVVRSWAEVAHSKIGIYIYVFILWAIIQNILFTVMGGTAPLNSVPNTFYAESLGQLFSLMLLGKSGLWYLYALVVYFAVTKLLKNYVILLLLFGFALNTFSIIDSPIFPYKNMTYCYLFFVVGVFLGANLFKGIQRLPLRSNIIFSVVGMIVLGALVYLDMRYRLYESVFSIYMLIVLVIYLYKLGFQFKILSYIGRNTLPIYIIHRTVIELFVVFILPLLLGLQFFNFYNHLAYSIIIPTLVTVVCIFCSIMLWKATNLSYGKYLYGYKH